MGVDGSPGVSTTLDALDRTVDDLAVRMYSEARPRERAVIARDLEAIRAAIDRLLQGRRIAPGDLRRPGTRRGA